MRMHVFFDQQAYVTQEQGGISRYFTELARALGEGRVKASVFGGFTQNRYLRTLYGAAGVRPCFQQRWDRLRINTWASRISRVWGRLWFARHSRHWSEVVYHPTGYVVDRWIARRANVVCLTVFDMIGELLCADGSRQKSLSLKQTAVEMATGIVCISECT